MYNCNSIDCIRSVQQKWPVAVYYTYECFTALGALHLNIIDIYSSSPNRCVIPSRCMDRSGVICEPSNARSAFVV